jgi:flagellar hook-length control protein FliK
MSTAVSTVGNLLMPSIALASGQGIPQSQIDQTAIGLETDSIHRPLGIPETVPPATPDNNLIIDPKKPDKQQQSFYLTFLEQIQTENLAVENTGNPDSQILPVDSRILPEESQQQTPSAQQPLLVQDWKTQYAVPAEYNNGQITTKMTPQAGLQLAQSIAELNGRTLPPIAEQTALSAENQPQQITAAEEPANTDTETPVETFVEIPAETPPEPDGSAANLPVPLYADDIDVVDSTPPQTGKTPPPVENSLTPQTAAKPVPLTLGSDKTTSAQNPQDTVESADSVVRDSRPLIQTEPVIISNLPKPLTDKTAADDSTQQNKPLNELSAADNTPRPGNVPTQSSTGDGTPQQENTFRNSADSNGQPQPDRFPDDSLSQKLNPVISQNPANPPRQESKPAADTSSGSTNFANVLAADNPQNLFVHQTSASQQSAGTANNTPAGNYWQNVGEQLFTQIQNSVQQNQQQITIRLNPPELGRVVIKFTEQDNQITGLLEVSRPQTKYEIEQALPELLKNLADSGIQIKNFDVLVKDQPQNDFYRDAFAQTGYGDRSSQQNFAEGSPGNFHTPDQPSNTNVAGYQTAPVSQQVVTDNSINILI